MCVCSKYIDLPSKDAQEGIDRLVVSGNLDGLMVKMLALQWLKSGFERNISFH